MPKPPLVSVVMPVYNGDLYLCESIDSILNQTFSDFEFIIINDGSTDGTGEILKLYEQLDKRMRVYNQEHSGVTASRNRGCRLARGKYIAPMDADDVSLPDRFAKQVRYLKAHPEIGILDTWVERINKKGILINVWRSPTTSNVIKWEFFFGNPLRHSSIMMRRDVVEPLDFYGNFSFIEDFYLLARALDVTQVASLPEVLSQIRYHEDSLSKQIIREQHKFGREIIRSLIAKQLSKEVSIEAVRTLYYMNRSPVISSLEEIDSAADLLMQLYESFIKTVSMNSEEAGKISHSAGNKFFDLAKLAGKKSITKSIVIFTYAFRLNPWILYTRIVVNGIKRILRSLK